MYFLGVDPDMTNLALAVVNEAGQPVALHLVKRRSGEIERDGSLAMIQETAQWLGTTTMNEQLPEHGQVGAIAVEGQEIVYSAKHGKNPRSMLFLAPISGAVLGVSTLIWPDARLFFPAPAEWKGQVPKEVHQARIFKGLGWEYAKAGGKQPYCYPLKSPQAVLGSESINKGDWKHVADAIGLAQYAMQEWTRLTRIESTRRKKPSKAADAKPEPSHP